MGRPALGAARVALVSADEPAARSHRRRNRIRALTSAGWTAASAARFLEALDRLPGHDSARVRGDLYQRMAVLGDSAWWRDRTVAQLRDHGVLHEGFSATATMLALDTLVAADPADDPADVLADLRLLLDPLSPAVPLGLSPDGPPEPVAEARRALACLTIAPSAPPAGVCAAA